MHSLKMASNVTFVYKYDTEQTTMNIRIKAPHNMLSDILVWLLLCNAVADKHILITVFIFARGTKCSGDASLF